MVYFGVFIEFAIDKNSLILVSGIVLVSIENPIGLISLWVTPFSFKNFLRLNCLSLISGVIMTLSKAFLMGARFDNNEV